MSLSAVSDLKTTRRSLGTIATLSNWHSKHLRYQALDCQTHAGVLTGQRGQRTSPSPDGVPAVSLDMREGAELLVHHLADHRHAGAKFPGGSFSPRQLAGEPLAGSAKYGLDLIGRQPFGERVNQIGQKRNVRARQELLDLRREFEHMGWSCGAWALAGSSHDAIAFHSHKLRAYSTSREPQLGCNVISGQAARAAKKSDDAATAGVEKLSFQY
jgi:hypothetical protein